MKKYDNEKPSSLNGTLTVTAIGVAIAAAGYIVVPKLYQEKIIPDQLILSKTEWTCSEYVTYREKNELTKIESDAIQCVKYERLSINGLKPQAIATNVVKVFKDTKHDEEVENTESIKEKPPDE